MRRSLLWLLLPILLAIPLLGPLRHNFYYISFVSFVAAYIVFYLWPFLCVMFHTKPLWVEDLETAQPLFQIKKIWLNPDEPGGATYEITSMGNHGFNLLAPGLDSATQVQFKKIFVVVINFMMAAVLATVINYFVYEVETEERNIKELIAFTGGLLAFCSRCQNLIGKVLLKVLTWWKRRHTRRNLDVELVSGPMSDDVDADVDAGEDAEPVIDTSASEMC